MKLLTGVPRHRNRRVPARSACRAAAGSLFVRRRADRPAAFRFPGPFRRSVSPVRFAGSFSADTSGETSVGSSACRCVAVRKDSGKLAGDVTVRRHGGHGVRYRERVPCGLFWRLFDRPAGVSCRLFVLTELSAALQAGQGRGFLPRICAGRVYNREILFAK